MSCRLKPETEYKVEYAALMRSLGDPHLVPDVVSEWQSRFAPQIGLPKKYVFCEDYDAFMEKTRNPNVKESAAVNMASMIAAVYRAYYAPPSSLPQFATVSSMSTWVGCGSLFMPRGDQYEMLDLRLEFGEPDGIARLVGGPWRETACTFRWLAGLAFAEMKADYLHGNQFEFHAPLCALVENCFAFWQIGEEFMICTKPSLNLDFRLRLHSDTGMAARFPSGNGLYALRGVKVDEKYITEPVSGKDLMKERNAQVRMVLLEKYGAKLIDDMPHKVVSKKGTRALFGFEKPHTRLIEMTWEGFEKIRMLHLKWRDKERKDHETLIHVPATLWEFQRLNQKPPENIDDCEEMRRWVMRLNPEDMLIKET